VPEPAAFLPKLAALGPALAAANPWAIAVAAVTVAIIAGLKRVRPHWPGMLIAVALSALAVGLGDLPVATIGSRFGDIPRSLPLPSVPDLSWGKVSAVLPDALSFALLGAIESLLSAVVADGMTGRRHRSNCELVAQGFANIGSALFGGICATGTIARTATNVRAGARGPIAGMLHAAFLLAFMLLAAPLARHIPLAALAGVLVMVAWTMAEKAAFWSLLRTLWGDAIALLATFLLTVLRDLTEGIIVGFAIGTLLFLDRMARAVAVEAETPLVVADKADTDDARAGYDAALATSRDVTVFRISGAFFFGAVATVGAVLDRLAERPRALVLDFAAVPFLDSTAANTIESFARRGARRGATVMVTGASPSVRRVLLAHGVRPPLVQFHRTVDDAVAAEHATPAS
jgi:SulP family sulfate permease